MTKIPLPPLPTWPYTNDDRLHIRARDLEVARVVLKAVEKGLVARIELWKNDQDRQAGWALLGLVQELEVSHD